MSLYAETFYTRELSELFEDRYAVSQLLRVEAALAMAQAKVGIIPEAAAKTIADCCVVDAIDINALKNDVVLGGNVAIPLVKQLTKLIKNSDFEASKYVHLGATSQDIIDTATISTSKEYIEWLEVKLNSLETILIDLTKKHIDTIVMGRTLLQQAKPMTFGLKTAGWLESISRSKSRLYDLKSRLLCIQLGGAVGSGNTNITTDVQFVFAKLLGLSPSFPWQTQRDSLVEFASFLGILSGSLGKIAKDISLLMQTEVAEVFEGAAEGKGGSSTMPHKRNPVGCALILSNAARTPGLISTMLSAMPQEHERSAGLWHTEWETLSQLMSLTAGSLEKAVDLIGDLEVDKERMLQNIEITNGLIYAEKVSFQLSKTLGKMQAHESVKKACKIATQQRRHLKEVVLEMHPQIENIDKLFQPKNAIGNSIIWVKNLLKAYS
ncbi:3-carboxy-cis,cis-muconate cycloisomerase [Maribacter sp. MMG018]|uniref:3-carboxy-cis,cis-muconate cycloisomerase n=1 Tax=Maribacter sp. MMG018 TaxID=2822688 RepID=UPI001B3923AE|nr:3-carboxy-cis,cis-muconate cycloisomerase [Maribacter sp. MMG018]MBQ4913261.1 3-carboxy-cis,cis-muconate cycloisomerase [Maribacter sp. MMG018]